MVMPSRPPRSAALSSTFAIPSSARSLANVNMDVSMVRMLPPPRQPYAHGAGRINFHDDGRYPPEGVPAPSRQVGADSGGHAERLCPGWRSARGAGRSGDHRRSHRAARLVPNPQTAGDLHPFRRRAPPDFDVEVVTTDRASRVLLLARVHAWLWRHRGRARLRGRDR